MSIMKYRNKTLALLPLLCLALNANAQYDGDIEDWTLDLPEEEEEQKPQHIELKNALHLQFSPSTYKLGEDATMRMNEFQLGYSRYIQVLEEKPYFVEVGADMKVGLSLKGEHTCAITFRVPVNVMYKFYLRQDKDWAIAPYAGASFRVIALGIENADGVRHNLVKNGDWERCQVSWQTGLRFYMGRYFGGVSYSRDFRDDSKFPCVHECGVHVGLCF